MHIDYPPVELYRGKREYPHVCSTRSSPTVPSLLAILFVFPPYSSAVDQDGESGRANLTALRFTQRGGNSTCWAPPLGSCVGTPLQLKSPFQPCWFGDFVPARTPLSFSIYEVCGALEVLRKFRKPSLRAFLPAIWVVIKHHSGRHLSLSARRYCSRYSFVNNGVRTANPEDGGG